MVWTAGGDPASAAQGPSSFLIQVCWTPKVRSIPSGFGPYFFVHSWGVQASTVDGGNLAPLRAPKLL